MAAGYLQDLQRCQQPLLHGGAGRGTAGEDRVGTQVGAERGHGTDAQERTAHAWRLGYIHSIGGEKMETVGNVLHRCFSHSQMKRRQRCHTAYP